MKNSRIRYIKNSMKDWPRPIIPVPFYQKIDLVFSTYYTIGFQWFSFVIGVGIDVTNKGVN